ncbi:MAG: flagellin [Hydrogenophaga sp.]|jgi:flagellin|uniref:flagellin N-terminal helical domain-containing protein n=1 Tax=Hydrogenophaga sp. TaxID=1904254 RepID=UPI00276A765F|nr:flagellin [Hydrogenophaga sp.]MDP3132021.1 flagellin [Burkholderiaceae bacterium]MDP3425593.1 flagellin [Burkholderiaceae bacterium]MDZ4188723.1 flagellin [Hydrogenophaga sp.]
MAMTINTNSISLNAQRNAANNAMSLSTTMARLSSGLRVNSSKDDAAGLAIADRMNTQVRGMNVAIRNANDGISLAQTAEGGLASINDMLQRMRELAVQSVNATNTSGDIAKLNNEYVELRNEVGRTMSATTFNGQTVLNGSADYTFQVGANSSTDNQITVSSGNITLSGNAAMATVFTGASASALTTSAALTNSATIGFLDAAISAVNDRRATLGAVQSRFEQTISNLRIGVENQAAARGRIMDADFASETANLSRSQILQQAGTAMIAQANQLPQNVMSLLR